MPRYNYECLDCREKAVSQYGEAVLNSEKYEELILFETSHGMNPTKKELAEATICPRCNGNNAQKVFYNYDVYGYTAGYGWLDKTGRSRDMHKYKLVNEDPYAKYREPGEAEDLKHKLDKKGQYDPNTKVFRMKEKSGDD